MSVAATGKVTFLFHYVYDYTSPLPFILEGGRERERERGVERERERGGERDREAETERERDKERERETDKQTDRDKERERERTRQTERELRAQGVFSISILTNLTMNNFALLCPAVLYNLPICFWVSLHKPLNLDLFANGHSTRNRIREWKCDLQQMYYDSISGQ